MYQNNDRGLDSWIISIVFNVNEKNWETHFIVDENLLKKTLVA